MKKAQVRGIVTAPFSACPQHCPKGCTQVGATSPQVCRRRPHPLWITRLVRVVQGPTVDPPPDASRAGQREPEEASADLLTVADQIVEQVQVLDGLVRFRFGDDPKLMEAWATARSVLEPLRVVMPAA